MNPPGLYEPWRRADYLWLGAILVVAAALRLARLDLVSITADEGIHGTGARNVSLLWFEMFPVVGLPSVGIRNSALFMYLIALPNFVWRHPLSGVAFIAALNLLSVAMTYRLGRRWFGRPAAIVGAALLAVSPWAVLYARNMWPPSAVIPAALLVLGAGLRFAHSGGNRTLFILSLAIFLVPQLHFSGFCAPAWIAIVLAVSRRRFGPGSFRALLLGALLGAATWAPWIYHQQQQEWSDLAQFTRLFKKDGAALEAAAKAAVTAPQSPFSASALADSFAALLAAGRMDYWFRTPTEDLPEFFTPHERGLRQAAGALAGALFLAGCGLACRSLAGRLLLLWIAMPFVLLAALRPTLHPHYLWIAFPVPFLFMGLTLRRGALGMLAAAAMVVVIAADLATVRGWAGYVAAGRTDGADRYQLSYAQRYAAVRSVLDEAGRVEIDVAGFFSGLQPAYSYIHDHEAWERGRGRWPKDRHRLYWFDETHGDEPPLEAFGKLNDAWPQFRYEAIEKQWRVGPTRIFKLRGRP